MLTPDVDWLANVIRSADGNHSLGAGALAEKIVEAMAALQPAAPDGWIVCYQGGCAEPFAIFDEREAAEHEQAGAGVSVFYYSPQPADDVVRDAERYRFLRSQGNSDHVGVARFNCDDHDWIFDLNGTDMDEYIDAAMAKEKA